MKPRVFALILNYNRKQDTLACAASLLASQGAHHLRLVVIDNGPDNLSKYFSKHLSTAHYLKSPGNIGFAAGNNQGISYALENKATHILIINPDVVVERNFLLPLLATFAKHPRAGIVAPTHTHPSGQGTAYGLGGTVNWRLASFPHVNQVKLTLTKPRQYDLLTFACVLIKREVFERVGGMDERYFLYLEDVDFCITVKQAGFLLYLNPSVIVAHATSASFDNPVAKLKYSARSHIQFIAKWYSFPYSLIPLVYNFFFYSKLYILWTLKNLRHK